MKCKGKALLNSLKEFIDLARRFNSASQLLISVSNISKSFFTVLKKSGIINFTFYDFCHTIASQLAMAGVDLYNIKELLGHQSLEMTHKKPAVDVLAQQIGT